VSSKVEEKILRAAVDSFAADGFHGSTTKLICDRAGCTEGSLFRLFGSKEKLFAAALLRAYQTGRMSNEELARVLENDDNFERGLRRGMLEFFDRLDDRYIRLATFAYLGHPELVRDHLADTAVTQTVARTILREVYRRNLRDDIDPQTAAEALLGSLWHFAFTSRIMAPDSKAGSREAKRATVKNFVEIWSRGMRKPTSPTTSSKRRTPRK
jgi:AcrR family transcriptional regulator